jgi:uncharacterized membrane protein YjjP (DUF1212 family)
MSNADAEQRCMPPPEDRPSPGIRPGKQLDPAAALDLVSTSAKLLFENGQTTERMVKASEQLAEALGLRATLFPCWSELVLRIEDDAGSRCEIVGAEPAGMDMNKVTATMVAIEKVCDGRMDATGMRSALEAITRLPAVSIVRFALFAAAGAAALGVIFGTAHLLSLGLIALSAGAGACVRRWLAGMSRNLFLQPFCAALLAGVIGAIAVRLQLSSVLRLVAVCPCMVLVPGPHFLNGMIDLARARITLGAARIGYAVLITLMISAGLLLGLALGGVSLPAAGPSYSAPFAYDVVAAGIAVAAYGTFFAMPWRMLPIPILIGMLAHASRWEAISVARASAGTAALVACLVVGVIITPIADRVRLPFAGLAFASVVSLVPGVFLFRMAGGMVDLVALGPKAPQELFAQVVGDGTTAILIILAMSFGLIFPKMCIQNLTQLSSQRRGGHEHAPSTADRERAKLRGDGRM